MLLVCQYEFNPLAIHSVYDGGIDKTCYQIILIPRYGSAT